MEKQKATNKKPRIWGFRLTFSKSQRLNSFNHINPLQGHHSHHWFPWRLLWCAHHLPRGACALDLWKKKTGNIRENAGFPGKKFRSVFFLMRREKHGIYIKTTIKADGFSCPACECHVVVWTLVFPTKKRNNFAFLQFHTSPNFNWWSVYIPFVVYHLCQDDVKMKILLSHHPQCLHASPAFAAPPLVTSQDETPQRWRTALALVAAGGVFPRVQREELNIWPSWPQKTWFGWTQHSKVILFPGKSPEFWCISLWHVVLHIPIFCVVELVILDFQRVWQTS